MYFQFSRNQNESLYKTSSCYGVEQDNTLVYIDQRLQSYVPLDFQFSGNQNESLYKTSSCKKIFLSTLIDIYKSDVPLDFQFSRNRNEGLYKTSSCYGVKQNNIFVYIDQGFKIKLNSSCHIDLKVW